MNTLFIWMGISIIFALLFGVAFVFLIIISKKTHSIIEFKSFVKGTPISLFFQDNRYCEWKNSEPDAGLVEDEDYGSFIIDSTYVDEDTKNVLVPFNSSFAVSLNVKAAKLADDLTYRYKQKGKQKKIKKAVKKGVISEKNSLKTMKTSVDFSTIKRFVSPILPHNIKSKIVNTVQMRLKGTPSSNVQNIILLSISAIGALILGGIVLKVMVL